MLFAVALFGVGYVAFDLYGKALWRYAQSVVPALRPSSAPRGRAPATTTTTTAAAPSPAPPPETTSGAPVEPAPSVVPTASGAPADDTQACIQPFFPEKTFVTRVPDLGFLCTETQPAKGAGSLHTQVVLGGGRGGASEAMKEWATMGWYGMAVFAIARARCCTDPQPLKTPTTLEHCKLDERLMQLAKAVLESSNEVADAALRDYTAAVNCMVRGGAADVFGQEGYPKGGEVTSFKVTYGRVRQLVGKP
jgi:hypothetical protein